MNAYATVDSLKSGSALDISGDERDARLRAMLESVSRQIDGYCFRHFYTLRATRLFDGCGAARLETPDLISVDEDGLRTDDDGDLAHETLWDAADYRLHPANAAPTAGLDGSRPHHAIIAVGRADGRRHFPRGLRSVRVSGEWGYRRAETPARETLQSAVDSAASVIVLTERADIEVGCTLLIDDEQIYALAARGNAVSVLRGVNGSAAAPHASGASIAIRAFPPPVREAAFTQAARLWSLPASETLQRVGGASRMPVSLDADIRRALSPYRRLMPAG